MPKPYYFCSFFSPLAATFWEALGGFIVSLCVCSPALSQGLAGDTHRDFAAPHCIAASSLPDSISSNSGLCLLSSVSLLCLNSSSLRCSWEVVPRQKAGQLVSPCEFFFFERLLSFTVSFPLPENHCQVLSSFMALWPFLVGGLVLYH